MIGQPRCHCWRRLSRWLIVCSGRIGQSRVNPAEVVVSEVQSERGMVVIPFLAVSVGQSRHAANGHSDVKILPFGMGGANPVVLWVA